MSKKGNKIKFSLGLYLNLGLSAVFAIAIVYLVNEIQVQERNQAREDR